MLDAGEVFIMPPLSQAEKRIQAEHSHKAFSRGLGQDGDHLMLLACYNTWRDTGFNRQWCRENFIQDRAMNRARDVRDQLDSLCDRVELKKEREGDNHAPDSVAIRKAITAGYFYNLCRLKSAPTAEQTLYQTVKTKMDVYIHPASTMFKRDPPCKWLIYHSLVKTTREYMREVIAIDPEWLTEIAPHYYRKGVDFNTEEDLRTKTTVIRTTLAST
jgi:pre-mRNA-splicing factor ATP-dependent RNA helicase DHX16